MKLLKKPVCAAASHSIFFPAIGMSANKRITTVTCMAGFVKWAGVFKQWLNREAYQSKAYPVLNRYPCITDWAPLIKASAFMQKRNTGKSLRQHGGCSLSGCSVLCIGGRIKLYPIYKQLIQDAGGNFIAFHGDATDTPEKLPRMLREADMIICPVDCINHEDYFAVKKYCQRSSKPCVLLDRSGIDTFAAGIRMLIYMAVSKLNNKEYA